MQEKAPKLILGPFFFFLKETVSKATWRGPVAHGLSSPSLASYPCARGPFQTARGGCGQMVRKGMTTPWACREGPPPPAWVFPPSFFPPRVAEAHSSRGFAPQTLHGTPCARDALSTVPFTTATLLYVEKRMYRRELALQGALWR